MKKAIRHFPTGDAGWGVSITSGKIGVVIAITGPNGGHYPGALMTPEQAEEIGLGLIHKAQEAREKAGKN